MNLEGDQQRPQSLWTFLKTNYTGMLLYFSDLIYILFFFDFIWYDILTFLWFLITISLRNIKSHYLRFFVCTLSHYKRLAGRNCILLWLHPLTFVFSLFHILFSCCSNIVLVCHSITNLKVLNLLSIKFLIILDIY